MYKISFLITFFLFINIGHGQQSFWLYELESTANSCGNELIRVSTYLNNTCYDINNGASLRFTFNITSKEVVRYSYSEHNCAGSSGFVKYSLETCYSKIKYTYRNEPPIELGGFAALERVPSNSPKACGYYESHRHLLKLNSCGKVNPAFNAYMTAGSDTNIVGNIYTIQCPTTDTTIFSKCTANEYFVTGIVTPTSIVWGVSISVITGLKLQLDPFANNYKFKYKYSVEYYDPSAQVYKMACSSIWETDGCTINLDNLYSYTKIRIRNLGDPIIASVSDSEYVSNDISLPQKPIVNSISIAEYGTKWVYFDYQISNLPTTFNVSVNGVYIPSCSSFPFCRVDGLPLGGNISIQVSSSNAQGTSNTLTNYVVLYNQLTTPIISSVIPSENQIVATYSSTQGIPSTTTYTVQLDGVNVPQCTGRTTTSCTITGLPTHFQNNLVVIATNDGDSKSSDPFNVVYIEPTLSSINVTTKTKSIYFEYNGNPTPSSYNVLVNGISQPDCSTTNSCLVSGLQPASPFSITITGTNFMGTSVPVLWSGTTYPTVTKPTITTNPSPNQIIVDFSSTGGVPNEIYYTVKLDNVDYPSCTHIVTTQCILNGLEAQYLHTITVSVSSDGDSFDDSTIVNFQEPVMSPIVIDTKTTKSINFTYSASNNPTSYQVTLNGVIQSQCSTTTVCLVSGLAPGSEYNILVTATNNVGTSPSVMSTGNLFDAVGVPSISATPSVNKIIVNYVATGGVPDQTKYTIKLDNKNVVGCESISLTTCTITGLEVEFQHNIIVIATNDGFSQQNSTDVVFLTPVMDQLQVEKRTKSIQFSYSATQNPIKYTVLFNGEEQTSCSTSTNCLISNLIPGSTYSISVTATNTAGESSVPALSSGNLYSTVGSPSVTATPSSGQIIVDYSSTDGIPNETLYSTKIDNVVVSGCNNISTLQCTITGLNWQFRHNILVEAFNDGDIKENSTDVIYLAPTINPIIIVEIRTNSISFNYSATHNPTSYNVTVNSVVQDNCSDTTTCKVTGLVPGSEVSISIEATNYVGTSVPSLITKQLYPSISSPSINAKTTYNSITVTYNSTGGVPTETLYTTQLDDVDVVGCVQTKELECLITGLLPLFTHNVTVIASNDGLVESTKLNVTSNDDFPLDNLSFTKTTPTLSLITSYWTVPVGGESGKTFYDLSISMDNSSWSIQCADIQTAACEVDNLIPSTLYYLRVTAKNTIFDSIYDYTSMKTLNPSADQCQCNNNGYCDASSGECICNSGWIGSNCGIKYDKPPTNNPPEVKPNPNYPGVDVDNGGKDSKASFYLNRIIEKANGTEEVFSLLFSELTWSLTNNVGQVVEHPSTGQKVTMNQWTYTTTIPKAQSLSVKFTQYLPIGDETVPDFPMEFAGEKFNLTLGSLKYQIDIKKWSFQSDTNVLEIQSTIVNSPDNSDCYELPELVSSETSQVTTVILQQPNGDYLYGRFSKRILLDQIPRLSTISISSSNESSTSVISIVVEYFDQELSIDPEISILPFNENSSKLPESKCNDKKSDNKWKIIVGAVVGGVGLIAAATVTTLLIKKYRLKKRNNDRLATKLRNIS
ncbi:hypothetical protein PPL_11559 [Heterostelium album PN500]|uniref:Uncharacterized protein n=1 Tax=Heterostelium pallidum (strain ATCC 26659 / Pp 5 / PN500) TaxID=670386 RepID=D3BVG8_HETP5|nr:hypothetical protein PPL_11559 [Heterostelium album PN500]EFA74591.1 hypothetical protein PPL_11559 [Heterostelium album PN500]|eukprot:XP_020426725.1 hypothetical protein PPL_11559 [Heterostelium album PN500]